MKIHGINKSRLSLEKISVGDRILFPLEATGECVIKTTNNLLVTTKIIDNNGRDKEEFPAIKEKKMYKGRYITEKSRGKVYKEIKINADDWMDYQLSKFEQ
ncbi:hypothetical protein M0R19_02915 [Candidatus Pacearchaeota archaeon]|nr:hypothetical protein [Candidatus Pacearchaeota archaeon]